MRAPLIAALVCVGLAPRAAISETLEELGTFEREAADFALAKKGLVYEPKPQGRKVRSIHVVNLPVFTDRAGFLQWFNVFHITTQEKIIAREVLVQPGDAWDEAVIAETKRTLSDPLFTALVVVLPVQTGEPDTVDLLVVTRDVWSLRLNANFEIQGKQLTALSIAPAENNLLGRKKTVTVAFSLDQGRYSIGPSYLDKNLLGSRLRLSAGGGLLFSRADNELEGSFGAVSLGLPLWSLARKWAWSSSVSYSDQRVRLFRGARLRGFDNPDTLEREAIPWLYDLDELDFELSGTRQFGSSVKHQITIGYDFTLDRASVIDGFPYGGLDNPTRERVEIARAAFEREALPRSERASALEISYSFFVPRFVIYRNLNTYDLAENSRLGPEISLSASAARKEIGSERNFNRTAASAGWTFPLTVDGVMKISGGVSSRIEAGDFIDTDVTGNLFVATPTLWRLVRPVGRLNFSGRYNERDNLFFTLGGDSGLRGFPIGDFSGLFRVVGNVEARSTPVQIWFAKAGLLLFWDFGHAADQIRDLEFRHDVGFGLRVLVPEAQPTVFRFDYAFPLNGRDTFPGRFSAGFAQTF